MSSVDFIACSECQQPVPSNRTIRSTKGSRGQGAAVCTTCAHSEAGAPRIEPLDVLLQIAALPWTPSFIECIGVVQFDLRLGQVVEYLYPPLPFSTAQETELAFLCFPDANHIGDGDSFHDFVYAYNTSEFDYNRNTVFRANDSANASPTASPQPAPTVSPSLQPAVSSDTPPDAASGSEDAVPSIDTSSSRSSPVHRPTNQVRRASVDTATSPTSANGSKRAAYDASVQSRFCSTMFRQRRDATIQRGAQQKALFVMSSYPFPALFHKVLRALCNGLFDTTTDVSRETLISMAWRDVSLWPRPMPCREYNALPLLGEVIHFTVPRYVPADLLPPIWSSAAPSTELTIHQPTALDRLRAALERKTVDESTLCAAIAVWEATTADAPEIVFAWLAKNGWDSAARRFGPSTSPLGSPQSSSPTTVAFPAKTELEFLMELLRSAALVRDTPPFAFALTSPAASLPSPTSPKIAAESLLSLFRHTTEVTPAVCRVQNDALRLSMLAAHEALSRMQIPESDNVFPRHNVRQLLSEVEIHSALFPHVTKAYKLWELVITGSPIAFLGPSAPVVSAMVLSVAALAAPLSYVGLVRPYVTINNREVDHGIDRVPQGPTLVGATNPFFIRHLDGWPHLVCVSQDLQEATSHKTLPASSDKRQKQQFKLKNRMFCSRHYLVKTDKSWGGGTTANAPALNKSCFVDESLSATSQSADVLRTFHDLTAEFIAPVAEFISVVMRRHQPYFLAGHELRRLVSHRAVLEALQAMSPVPASFSRFKNAKDATEVYEAFLLSPTGQRWVQSELQQHYRRFLVEDAANLEDVVRLCPAVADRYDALAQLQADLDHCLAAPLLDVPLVRKLSQLCAEIVPLRETLVADGAAARSSV
jgi:hypothetical protein